MPRNLTRWLIGGVVGIVFSTGIFAAGFISGQAYRLLPFTLPTQTPGVTQPVAGSPIPTDPMTPDPTGEAFAPLWEAWRLLHEEFVDQPLDDTLLVQGAIRGMLEATGDKHTSYMNPEEYRMQMSDFAGELEGIGAYVDTSGEYVAIVSPLPGSPAEAAGLLPGDKIVKVDGEDVTGLDGFKVIFKVRGPAGSTVHLTIQREGQADPLEFDIVRAKITIPSVESRMLDGGIAYVKINEFGDNTAGDLDEQLRALMSQDPRGLILDLRNNPGGWLNAAIDVASEFIPNGLIAIERYGDGRETPFDAEGGGRATEVPMVVLINKGSASASEIVAGAIQDHGRGLLLGETSYGKGSVQNLHELSDGNGAIRVTVADWLTPDRRHITGQGLTPNRVVEMTDEDRAAERDPQLDAAAEFLRNQN